MCVFPGCLTFWDCLFLLPILVILCLSTSKYHMCKLRKSVVNLNRARFEDLSSVARILMCGGYDFPPLIWQLLCPKPKALRVRRTPLFKDGITQPAAAISTPIIIESVLVDCTSEGVCSVRKILQYWVLGGLNHYCRIPDWWLHECVSGKGSWEKDQIAAGHIRV